MKRTMTLLLCSAAAYVLAAGCSKNSIWVDYGSASNPSGGGETSQTASLVSFRAAIESRNMLTRAMAPMRKNVRVKVSAYLSSVTDASGLPVAAGSYQAIAPGQLQGLDGFRMFLPDGKYNFYAASVNSPYPTPEFTGGLSAPLVNGFDYLWWGGREQEVRRGQAGIPIVFLHAATQIILHVSSGDGVTLNELFAARIYPPEPGGQMSLATGEIVPATGFSATTEKMAVGGELAQYTVLPIKSLAPLRIAFDVRVNGETALRTYEVAIPLPDGELKAGDSYRFLAVLDGSEVSFPSVSVAGWVPVDETGKPLYPDEV